MKSTILTSTELKSLYRVAVEKHPQCIMPLALQAHAGLRDNEVSRLELNDIDFDERRIYIRASQSKTGRLGVIEDIPDAVWSWLEYCRVNGLFAVPANWQRHHRRLFKAAGLEPEGRGILRHSFACHLYGLTYEPEKIAGLMGWAISIFHWAKGNLGVSTRQNAESYFSVMPPRQE